jgi:hypothetical protein
MPSVPLPLQRQRSRLMTLPVFLEWGQQAAVPATEKPAAAAASSASLTPACPVGMFVMQAAL